jgi:hypothetical protein
MHGVLLATGLSFCFSLSWLATEIALAPIFGAFAVGLILKATRHSALNREKGRSAQVADTTGIWRKTTLQGNTANNSYPLYLVQFPELSLLTVTCWGCSRDYWYGWRD